MATNRYPKGNPDRFSNPKRGPAPSARRPSSVPRGMPRSYPVPPKPSIPPTKFPGMPRPVKPFGVRPPFAPPGFIPPVLPRIAMPLARIVSRAFPLGLALWTAYDLWRYFNELPEGSGSTMYRFCRLPDPLNRMRYDWSVWADACYTYQPAGSQPNWTPIYDTLVKRQAASPFVSRFDDLEKWRYPANPGIPSGPVVPVDPVPMEIPPPPTFIPYVPWVPIAVPPLAPMPFPIPRPSWLPDWLKPDPQNDPERAPAWTPPGYPGAFPPQTVSPPKPDKPRRPRPGQEPKPEETPKPQPQLNPRRPGRRTKERKLLGTAGQRKLLGKLLSLASEAGDLLDILHDALPRELQGNDHPKSKLDAVWKNFDKIDLYEAFENIWQNHSEDRIYGQFFQAFQDAASEAGLDFPSLRNVGGL